MDRGSQHWTGVIDQNHPKKNKCKKPKWLVEEALQITEERRKAKGEREWKTYPTECRVPENSK